MKQKEPTRILATDCGSTTTKAILIEKRGDEYRLAVRGEAPTTVEASVYSGQIVSQWQTTPATATTSMASSSRSQIPTSW